MTGSWMLYALLVGVLLAMTAAALEGTLRIAGRPGRWVWAGALALTSILTLAAPGRFAEHDAAPVVMRVNAAAAMELKHQPTVIESAWLLLGEARSALLVPVAGALRSAGAVMPAWLDRGLAVLWIALSVALLLLFASVYRRFVRARREWPRAELHGTLVRVSPKAGPAVIGLSRPEIVVPRWLLGRSEEEQRLVLAHEQEHVRARDPLLLAGACVAAALVPWNPAAWWMLSRLRLAVELDCDARVLRRGATARSYGTLLIDLAGQCSGLRVGAPALADESSHLERRLLAMKPKFSRFAPARAALLGVASGLALLAACEAKLPTATEVADMKVADAEQGARKIALMDDTAANYLVDGVKVTAAEAHALPPEKIASIEVEKRATAEGRTSQISITTRKPGEKPAPHNVMFRVRGDSSVSGPDGQMKVRTFGGIVLVDGVRVPESTLSSIPPADIVSVEVVKGPAATQLYDAPEAANGVIKVTTKKGAARKP